MDYDFSGGQKQLFSLCCLLIRRHKAIVLDEATASVDLDTDQDMQKLIRHEFKESTVLTIAEAGPPDEHLQNGKKKQELKKSLF
ncbi:hypothetical protein EV178_004639 [Coemansia sp. RSA 1646]|nr:hypothetical protein EV178_004639 [Coemansia sp. RSA 1646]